MIFELSPQLDELVEETALKLLWTLQPGATDDPLPAVKRLLATFWEEAQEVAHAEAEAEAAQEEQAERTASGGRLLNNL